MAHCSPILPNPMASLLHDLPSSDSSTASSPQFKHSLVLARTLAFAIAVSPTIVTAHPYQGPDEENFLDGFKDKPDEHPQPQQQQRQEGEHIDDNNDHYSFDNHGRGTSGYCSSQQETHSVGMSMKRRSVTHSASPLSKTANCTTATDVAKLDMAADSPQMIAQSSARYIRFLLLPLLPLLFLALGGQTNPKFDTPARYM
ncbi:hypothetical protein BGX30_011915 [Mortierella sp. GBA39]|nr:hypothetical protein BGX30_011915 [Mortierella sp. GBA39]